MSQIAIALMLAATAVVGVPFWNQSVDVLGGVRCVAHSVPFLPNAADSALAHLKTGVVLMSLYSILMRCIARPT